jgi:hypothetical protein
VQKSHPILRILEKDDSKLVLGGSYLRKVELTLKFDQFYLGLATSYGRMV